MMWVVTHRSNEHLDCPCRCSSGAGVCACVTLDCVELRVGHICTIKLLNRHSDTAIIAIDEAEFPLIEIDLS